MVGQNPPQKGCGRFVAQTSGHLRAPPGTPPKIKNSRLWSENSSQKKCFFLRFRAHFQKGRIFLGHIFGQPPGTSGHKTNEASGPPKTPLLPDQGVSRPPLPPSARQMAWKGCPARICPTKGCPACRQGKKPPNWFPARRQRKNPPKLVSRLSPRKTTQNA